jgi:hypothetical protein
MPDDSKQWSKLLQAIARGVVIPIVGFVCVGGTKANHMAIKSLRDVTSMANFG